MDAKERDKSIKILDGIIQDKESELDTYKSRRRKLLLEKEYDEVISKYNDSYWKVRGRYIYIKKIIQESIKDVREIYYKGFGFNADEYCGEMNCRIWHSTDEDGWGQDGFCRIEKVWFEEYGERITREEFEKNFDVLKNAFEKTAQR